MKKLIGILFLILFSCEKNDYSTEECCWYCTISITYYHPGQNPYEETGFFKYQYCDMTDEEVLQWEDDYTRAGTTPDSIKFKQIAKCRK
jgi:hypothetical protein